MTAPIPPELCDLLALTLVPGLGPKLTAALLERFGSASAARRAGAEQLRHVQYIGEQLAQRIASALRALDLSEELGLIARHNVHLIARGGPEYPPALAEIADPPQLLYVRG